MAEAYMISSLIGRCFLGFASDDVFNCKAMSDDVVVCAGTFSLSQMTKAKLAWALAWREKVECNSTSSQAQSHDISTEARRAKDISRGVL